jgi:hypothetical protein
LHWRGTITHWKERLIELTQMVLRHSEDKSEPFMKPMDSPSRNNELYTDSNMASWSYKEIYDRWMTVLGIFGNITILADPENHRIGMSCILEITMILTESNNPPPTHAVKTLPRPVKTPIKTDKMSPSNSDSLATTPHSVPASPTHANSEAPTSLTRTPSANLALHTRSLSMDVPFAPINIDDPISPRTTPAQPAPTSPASEGNHTSPPSPIFDPLSPRTSTPTLTRLVHGNGSTTPATPILPPRNLSPIPTLAPPPTRTSNDMVLDGVGIVVGATPLSSTSAPDINKAPSDVPKREEIAMSILLAILPWIVESCCDELRHASHLQGVLCAFQALCRILCSPNFSFELDINMRFCTCLHVGFWASKEIASRIIASSARLFTFCRPGLTAIVPEFIKQIRNMFQDPSASLSPDLELAASSIVNSLICYPNHFGDLGYIRLEAGHKLTRFSFEEVKTELSHTLLQVLKKTSSVEGKQSAICGACVLMLEELFNERPRKEMISSFCNHILTYSHNTNEAIAQTALDVLSTLSHSNIASVDRALISTIIMCLCEGASSLIYSKEEFQGKENIILAHYWCLVEWIIPTSPTTIPRLSIPTVLSKLLEVVELGYYGVKALHPLDFVDTNSSQKDSIFGRKKRDTSLTTSTDPGMHSSNHKKSDILKKKRRDSLFETSLDLKTSAESPKLGGRKAEIGKIMKEVFSNRGKARERREKEKDKDKDHVDPNQHHLNEEDEDEKIDNASGKKTTKQPPGGHSPKIKESAETLLLCILNHYQSFPLFIGNNTTEDDTAPTLYFLHNNKAVWSFSDMRDDVDEAYTRVIIRDCTGKYIWNFKPCPYRDIPRPPPPPFLTPRRKPISPPFSPSSPPLSPSSPQDQLSSSAHPPAITPSNSPNHSPADSPPHSPREPELMYHRIKGEPPKYSDEVTPKGIDMLYQFIEFLQDNCPEIIESWLKAAKDSESASPPPIPIDDDKPYCVNPHYYKSSTETKQELLRQASIESQFYTNFSPTFRPQPMEKPKPLNRTTYFDTTRQFLSNFGFLSAENRSSMVRLNESGKLRRNLDALDKINERENFKVGVVYVDKGQTTQREILANSKGSHDYTTFLQGLGWEVELATHKGFMGGLDSCNGPVTVYSASSTYEIIYHVVTLMPTIANDDTQLHKKRHIGNDNVHIVWSENAVDSYDPNTILSQFNDAHIVIYPQASGLCQVQIYKKFKVQFFGPLFNGMLVSKKILPFLVRQTAINANKRVRERTAGYNKPYNIRQTRIQEIAGTCQKNSQGFDEFFAALYKPLSPFAPSSPVLSAEQSTTPVMKSHPRSNSSLTLRSETSATSIDEGLTSLDESDEELSTGNTSESDASEMSASDTEMRVKFKVPKINIPPSRNPHFLQSSGEIYPDPVLSP